MEGKKKNVFIAILGVTTVAAAGAAIYFGLKYNSLKIEASKKDEVISESNENDTTPKEIEKIVTEYGIPEVTTENCLNPKESFSYSEVKSDYLVAYGAYIYPSRDSSVAISLDADLLNKTFPDLTLYDENGKSSSHVTRFHEFDKKIAKVCFGGVAQGISKNELVFCLLEDGSIYCMNLYNAISNNNYDNYTKLDEMNDIIDLKSISISTPGSGFGSIAAVKRDGKFYDLKDILRDRGLVK